MYLSILYHPNNELTRSTEELAHELKFHTDKKIEFIDVDTKEGMNKVSDYGVVDYPALIVLTDDGQPYYMWQGPQLPSVSEVISYLNV
jgi:thiol-disulfide isomerase/thioredoxin